MGTKKVPLTHLDNADLAVQGARAGHDVWLRKYLPNADYSPQQIADAFPFVPDDVKAKIGVVTNNEQDWGWARRPGESVHDWMFRARDKTVAVARLMYAKGFRRFTYGNFSMGTYDVTSQEEREEFGNAWRDLYNTQKLDGAPVEWWLDMHNYVPDFSWLYDSPTGRGNVTWAVDVEVKRQPYLTKEGVPVVATWMEEDTLHGRLGLLPSSSRTIHRWDWYLTRAFFNFWSEMGVGFDYHIQRVKSTEMGCDKGGVGGAPAQGYTARQVFDAHKRMNALLYAPLDVYGDGRLMVPSPYGNGTWFASSAGEWTGYSILYMYNDQSIPVSEVVL